MPDHDPLTTARPSDADLTVYAEQVLGIDLAHPSFDDRAEFLAAWSWLQSTVTVEDVWAWQELATERLDAAEWMEADFYASEGAPVVALRVAA